MVHKYFLIIGVILGFIFGSTKYAFTPKIWQGEFEIVIAKNDNTHKFLARQFEKHTIARSYLVFVYGIIKPLKGNIKTLIGRSKINRQKMTANIQKGKNAITNYETISIYQGKKFQILVC